MIPKVNNAARSALIIILLSSISKALGLFRESALAAYYGASFDTDAYKVALDIPSFLLGIVGTAIAMTFIPVYTQYIKNKTEEERKHFLNNIFTVIFMIAVLLTTLGFLLTPVLVRLIAPGFKGKIFDLTVSLTMAMCLSIIFIAFTNLANGYLQSHEQFTASAVIGIPYNLLIIISILLFYKHGIKAVVLGTLIAFASQFAVQLPSMTKSGFRFRPVIDLGEGGLKEMLVLSMPIFVNGVFAQLYLAVERILASNLSEGSISALDYANKVKGLVFNIFITSVITVIYPRLSIISNEPDKMKQTLAKGLRLVILLSLPMAVGLLLLREPIVNILFERGAFDNNDTQLTSIALGYFSLSIIGTGIMEMLSTACYSLKDTKTPMMIGIAAICINIALNLLFSRIWGIGGLAVSASIASLAGGIILLSSFRKKYGNIGGKLFITMVKSAFSALIMGIAVFIMYKYYYSELLRSAPLLYKVTGVFAIIAAGALIYSVMLLVAKVEEISEVIKNISF